MGVSKVYTCEKCGAYFVGEKCPFCGHIATKALVDVNPAERLRTPSDLDLPVLVMCPPIFQKIYVENNVFMETLPDSLKSKFNPDTLFKQWFEVYRVLSMQSLVLTVPPNPLLQDLVWLNSFIYLPHVDEPTVVISNFKAEGRQPEADLAEWFLSEMGYRCYRIPDPEWYFEGYPDMKYLYDNIYIAGYGERTTKEALDWIAEKFDAKIIYLGKTEDVSYHGDTIFCPIQPTKVICVIPWCRKKGLKELEEYAEILPVEDEILGEFCITNNIPISYTVYAGTYIELFDPDMEEYEIEREKIDTLTKIVLDAGMDIVWFDISQFYFQGAALSCTYSRLNYADWFPMKVWNEYGNNSSSDQGKNGK